MNEPLIKIIRTEDNQKIITCNGADTDSFCSIHKSGSVCSLNCPMMRKIIEDLYEYETVLCATDSDYNPLTEKIVLEDGKDWIRCKYEGVDNIHLALLITLQAFEAL